MHRTGWIPKFNFHRSSLHPLGRYYGGMIELHVSQSLAGTVGVRGCCKTSCGQNAGGHENNTSIAHSSPSIVCILRAANQAYQSAIGSQETDSPVNDHIDPD